MGDLFGQTPAAEERDALAEVHSADAVAEGGDTPARFAARCVAGSGLDLVLATALQHIGEREPDRFDVDQHLTRARHGRGLLDQPELLCGIAEFVESPDAHRTNVFGATSADEARPTVERVTIVAIDGPTGVGKSTTARSVAERLGADLLLDPVSVSPLLDDYYTGEATPSAALDAELAFLRGRADLMASADPGRLVVADFTVLRTAPFAEFLARPDDRRCVLDEMRRLMTLGPRIDLLVLLHAEPDALLRRVRTRDRRAEVDLTIEHLAELRRHFAAWRPELLRQADAAIEIDTATWDPRRSDDLDRLVDRITEQLP